MVLIDHLIISIPDLWNEDPDFLTLNPAHYFDKERDRYERKVVHGIIHQVPRGYSETRHMPIDPGFPPPKKYISHDDIQQRVNIGWDNKFYHPGAYEGWNWITRADYGRLITAKVGDECYFHPSVTELENYLGEVDGKKLYRCQVHELIMAAGVPQGGYVLIKPILKDKQQEGIVLSVDDEDQAQRGIVRYARPGGPVAAGEVVLFQKDADWNYWIGDERLYAMQEEDVFMVLDQISA